MLTPQLKEEASLSVQPEMMKKKSKFEIEIETESSEMSIAKLSQRKKQKGSFGDSKRSLMINMHKKCSENS